MDGAECTNNIELTEKHSTDEELDEEEKAMKLFNLGGKENGKK